ncbi:type II/IV secretion system protein [Patescibacteria group bacterium]|nr:type II/IV secretion system protein [Patescibacteria group bacterium]
MQKELEEEVLSLQDLTEKLTSFTATDTTALLLTLLGSAVLLSVSDLHLEAEEQGVKLRARVDGMLQDVAFLSQKTYEPLLSRIKLLSLIKLNVSDRPQDGRFTFLFKESLPIEIRVSSLPSEHGESIVLRLLNPKSLKAIKDLGLRKDLLSLFQKEIKKPNGMLLVTGPTGSGKTTTLYAFLKEVQNPEIKIITIEDPIEYRLEGISQTQVTGKEYTFASGLRAIVRQDPDVILVGEIRDQETASIALQAALTGHLVFSTLHTNDAAGTIARLLSLGADPVNVSAALSLIIAQRLVRKICTACGKTKTATALELKIIREGLQGLSKEIMPKIPLTLTLIEPQGCIMCNNTGYKGRVGIFEAIVADDALETFVAKSPSIAQLRAYAQKTGMVSMHQDGLLKVLEKTTTLKEVERVTSE